MATPDEEGISPEVIEALHQAITEDTDFDPAQDTSPGSLQAVRELLEELELVRREGNLSHRSGGELAAIGLPAGPRRVGRFEIEHELGRGGQGVVFLARDPLLGRSVALKLPRPEMLSSPELLDRFLREARAASKLNHPAIVAMHEVGQDLPAVFLVSAYCSGGSLQSYLQNVEGRLPPREAAALVAELADGVHFAHQNGVLHRDIKPSNVLLAPRPETAPDTAPPKFDLLAQFSPKLCDFGLARLTEAGGDRTRSGTVLGTPAYMAPEQAGGELQRVGPPTDVYALGVLLYELLVGRPPFRGVTDADTFRQVLFEEPVAPRRLQADVRPDLEAICLCALEKDPAKRYATAAELAQDLRRFLAGETTRARPLARTTRVLRWARRRPALAALIVVSSLALVTIVAGAQTYDRWLRGAMAELKEESQTRRHMDYAGDIRLAKHARDQYDIAGMHAILARQIPEPGDPDYREFTWKYLEHSLPRSYATLRGHQQDVHAVTWTPDGHSVVSGGKDGTVRVWDAASGEQRLVVRQAGEVNEVVVLDGGRTIAAAGEDSMIYLWDLASGKSAGQIKTNGSPVTALAANDTTASLAACYADKYIRMWDTRTRELRWERAAEQTADSATFCLNGDALFTTHGSEGVWHWSSASGELESKHEDTGLGGATSLSSVVSGAHLAILNRTQGLSVVEHLKDWPPRARMKTPAKEKSLHGVAISSLDSAIAFGGRSGKIYLCSPSAEFSVKRVFAEHAQRVWKLAWSPSGRILASASEDGTVKLWNYEQQGTEAYLYPSCTRNLIQLCLALDGRRVATLDRANLIHLWDRDSRACVRAFRVMERTLGIAILPNNELLVVNRSGETRRFDSAGTNGTRGPQWGMCDLMAVSADLRRIAISDLERVVVRDALSLEVLAECKPDARPEALALSADGRRLAVATQDSQVEVWNTATGKLEFSVPVTRSVSLGCLAFSADGQRLVSCDGGGNGQIHDLATGKLLTTLSLEDDVSSLGLSPDGRTLAVASPMKLQFWDLSTYLLLASQTTDLELGQLEFSSDGKALLGAGKVSPRANPTESGLLCEWNWESADRTPAPETTDTQRLALDEIAVPAGPMLHGKFQLHDESGKFQDCQLTLTHIRDNPLARVRPVDAERSKMFDLSLAQGTANGAALIGPLPRLPGDDLEWVVAFKASRDMTDPELESVLKSVDVYLDQNGDKFFDPQVDRQLECRRSPVSGGEFRISIDAKQIDDIPPERERRPIERSFARLCRAAGEYARQQQFGHGYPCRVHADSQTAELVLIKRDTARLVSASVVPSPDEGRFPADRFDADDLLFQLLKRATAWRNVGVNCIALPTLYVQSTPGRPLRYEIASLEGPSTTVRDYPWDQLVKDSSCEVLFRVVHEKAIEEPRYLSGFPTGCHYVHDGVHLLICGMLKPGAGEIRTVPLEEIYRAIGE